MVAVRRGVHPVAVVAVDEDAVHLILVVVLVVDIRRVDWVAATYTGCMLAVPLLAVSAAVHTDLSAAVPAKVVD